MFLDLVGRTAVEVLKNTRKSPQRSEHHGVAEFTRQAIDSGLDAGEIGADGFSCDAGSAGELVKRLMGAP